MSEQRGKTGKSHKFGWDMFAKACIIPASKTQRRLWRHQGKVSTPQAPYYRCERHCRADITGTDLPDIAKPGQFCQQQAKGNAASR